MKILVVCTPGAKVILGHSSFMMRRKCTTTSLSLRCLYRAARVTICSTFSPIFRKRASLLVAFFPLSHHVFIFYCLSTGVIGLWLVLFRLCLLGSVCVRCPSRKFRLSLQPGIYIVSKETALLLCLGKIVPFVDLKDEVPFTHVFLHLGLGLQPVAKALCAVTTIKVEG